MESSLVISVDGLNARFLGAYGNSWIPTPAIDQLAAQGTLFEYFFANSDDPASNLIAMLSGCHPLLTTLNSSEATNRPKDLHFHKILVTDDDVIEQNARHFFDRTVLVKSVDSKESETTTSTLENVFSRSLDVYLETIPALPENLDLQLWIHCKGFYGNWDSPTDLQQWFKDESDPSPIDVESSPELTLDHDHDPDERLVFAHAYAAMVVRLDQCLEWLCSSLDSIPVDPTIVLAGVRGFPMGEHLEIGNSSKTYLIENTHIPLIVSNEQKLPLRVNTLFGSCSFPQLINNSTVNKESPSPEKNLVVSASEHFARIQSKAWSYTTQRSEPDSLDSSTNPKWLFAKPTDPLEFNEVSDVCPDIACELHKELFRQLDAFEEGNSPGVVQLDDEIYEGLA